MRQFVASGWDLIAVSAQQWLDGKSDKKALVSAMYDDDIPLGSASFKKYDNKCAEVKRVFVKEEYRYKGIANKLMGLLENAAREQGYCYLILESGEPFVAAMALYRKIGYKVIPNYGQYKDMPDSICMKKKRRTASLSGKYGFLYITRAIIYFLIGHNYMVLAPCRKDV